MASAPNKRGTEEASVDGQPVQKRPRGRPKGSKTNKKGKETAGAGGTPAPASASAPAGSTS